MSGLRRAIQRQFLRPTGLPGRLAGAIMANRPSNRQRNEWTVGLVAPSGGEALLEIGCGPGYALAVCAGRAAGLRLVGLDHSAVMTGQAMRRLERAAPGGDWQLITGGFERLRDWPQRFDAAWSVNVVQFLPDLEESFAAIRSVLRPGGRTVATYQPRHASPRRQDAFDKAAAVAEAMRAAGFGDIRRETLELKPVPAVAVIGSAG